MHKASEIFYCHRAALRRAAQAFYYYEKENTEENVIAKQANTRRNGILIVKPVNASVYSHFEQ